VFSGGMPTRGDPGGKFVPQGLRRGTIEDDAPSADAGRVVPVRHHARITVVGNGVTVVVSRQLLIVDDEGKLERTPKNVMGAAEYGSRTIETRQRLMNLP